MRSFSTRVLVHCALLTSISIVLSRFFSIRIPLGDVEALRIGFGTLPIVLAGFLFGPLAGALVGTGANILGALISSSGPIMPHFILVAALGGACPVLFWRLRGSSQSYLELFISIGLSMMLNSVLLISFFMNDLFGVPYAYMLPGRLLAWIVTAPVYPILILKIWKNLHRLKR